MALKKELLALLRCPACAGRAKVALTDDGQGLRCESCGRVYPVREDIPVMLIDEATPPTAAHV